MARSSGVRLWSVLWMALVGGWLVPKELAASEGSPERLTVIAASSARPSACGLPTALWQRVRRPREGRLCDLLLGASVRLSEDAEGARKLAARAAELAPERAEPLVLLGRAQLALGEYEEAGRHLASAEKLAPGALDAPLNLLAAARVDLLTGNYVSALTRYRRLIPRGRLLVDQREQQRALLEAAVVAQLVSPELFGEARAYAAEARRRGDIYYADLSRAVLALALHRQGRREEARAIAREVGGPWALSWLFEQERESRGRAGEITPVLPPGEREALIAVLTEAVDRELAQDAWGEYRSVAQLSIPAHLIEHAREAAGDKGVESEPSEADGTP